MKVVTIVAFSPLLHSAYALSCKIRLINLILICNGFTARSKHASDKPETLLSRNEP